MVNGKHISIPGPDKSQRQDSLRRCPDGVARAEYEGRKAALSASFEMERETAASAVKMTGRSGRLADRLRAKRFHQIFTYLDQVGPSSPLLHLSLLDLKTVEALFKKMARTLLLATVGGRCTAYIQCTGQHEEDSAPVNSGTGRCMPQ
jgi:hypothetical protein